jgi:hypothetical protein
MSQVVNYQSRVLTWLIKCFGDKIANDKTERCYRFFEEATELVQSLDIPDYRCKTIIDDVFDAQELASQSDSRCVFFEYSVALVKHYGMTKEECLRIVAYVYGRPAGDPEQEVGGVSVTLYALGSAVGIDIDDRNGDARMIKDALGDLCGDCDINLSAAAETELARINQPETIAKIREKQKAKPRFLD